MSDPANTPVEGDDGARRRATPRDIAIAVVVVLAFLAAMTLGALGHRWIVYLLLAGVGVLGWRSLSRISASQKAKVVESLERRERSTLGKAMQFLRIFAYLALGVALLQWLASRWG